MDELQQATGIISDVSVENGRHKFKINNKTYSFFETKQDGSNTKAWDAWQELSLKPGDFVAVAYKDTKSGQYTYHNALTFKRPANDQIKSIMADKKEEPKEPNWDSINWGKCKHGFLIEAFKKGMTLKKALPEAEAWADASMSTAKKETPEEPEEEINPENIPF